MANAFENMSVGFGSGVSEDVKTNVEEIKTGVSSVGNYTKTIADNSNKIDILIEEIKELRNSIDNIIQFPTDRVQNNVTQENTGETIEPAMQEDSPQEEVLPPEENEVQNNGIDLDIVNGINLAQEADQNEVVNVANEETQSLSEEVPSAGIDLGIVDNMGNPQPEEQANTNNIIQFPTNGVEQSADVQSEPQLQPDVQIPVEANSNENIIQFPTNSVEQTVDVQPEPQLQPDVQIPVEGNSNVLDMGIPTAPVAEPQNNVIQMPVAEEQVNPQPELVGEVNVNPVPEVAPQVAVEPETTDNGFISMDQLLAGQSTETQVVEQTSNVGNLVQSPTNEATQTTAPVVEPQVQPVSQIKANIIPIKFGEAFTTAKGQRKTIVDEATQNALIASYEKANGVGTVTQTVAPAPATPAPVVEPQVQQNVNIPNLQPITNMENNANAVDTSSVEQSVPGPQLNLAA